VDLSAGVFLRRSIGRVIPIVALAFALGCSSANAQQQDSSRNALVLLARAGCETGAALDGDVQLETGYLAMLGVSAKAYSFRVLNNGAHSVMIPAEQCRDPLPQEQSPNERSPQEQKSFVFILSHSFQNTNRIREGYHYLMDQRGQLLNAVHFQEGRSHLFAFVNLTIPVRRADFEAEKAIWIAKVSDFSVRQKAKLDTD
jgi:hypothetical protein